MNSMIDGDAAPKQRRAARASIVTLAAVACAALPCARFALPLVPVLLPMVGAIAAVAQVLTAAMLYGRYRSSGLASVAILALLFATSLATSLAFLVALPDVAEQTGLLRTVATLGAWYYSAGCLIFALQLAAYLAAEGAERRNRHATARLVLVRTSVASGLALAFGAALVPLWHSSAALLQGPAFAPLRSFVLVPLLLVALAVAFERINPISRRRIGVARLWLGVVTLATALQLLLAMECAGSHFDVGWVAAIVFWLAGSVAFLTAMVANVYDALSTLALRNEALYEQSVSDELTGLLNRRGFNLRFDEQVRRSTRAQEALALLLIDIDDFKRYNDTFGHQGGDRAIAAVARVVASMLRRGGDAGARIGGDEFAVILPKTDRAGALGVGERIRSGVERLALPQGQGARHPHVTVTVGATSMVLSEIPEVAANVASGATVLLGRADAALYAAKDAGRNCVRYAQAPVAAGENGPNSLAG
jgi:diguanylate cyclase (GGDEF)-like protein